MQLDFFTESRDQMTSHRHSRQRSVHRRCERALIIIRSSEARHVDSPPVHASMRVCVSFVVRADYSHMRSTMKALIYKLHACPSLRMENVEGRELRTGNRRISRFFHVLCHCLGHRSCLSYCIILLVHVQASTHVQCRRGNRTPPLLVCESHDRCLQQS